MRTLAIVGLLSSLGAWASAADSGDMTFPRSEPEAQGVSAQGLSKFVDALDKRIEGMHGVVVVRHGSVILEGWWNPYDAATRHSLYSLSKSFTSTAVGLAIAEGKLRLDDPVLKFFPEDAPGEPSKNLKAMRVSDLLRMSTGHQAEPSVKLTDTQAWTKTFLAQAVPFKPGTHFMYNTPATYMLSAIVQKATGSTVLDYLRPRLFDPLGIKDPTWDTSPQGVSLGGYGLSIRTEDIARFGQMYLQKGAWNGQQLVPASWVEAATTRQTSNGSAPDSDWDQGYGYQFWRSRHNAFRGDGAFGQYCVVIPEYDAVVAINSGVKDMQGLLNIVWDELLPTFGPSPLATDPAANAQLKARISALKIPTPIESEPHEIAGKVVGKWYSFPTNDRKIEAVTLGKNDDGQRTITLKVNGVDQTIACGAGQWLKGRAAFGPLAEQPAATAAAWTSDDTFTAKVVFVETPFLVTLRLKFQDGEVTMNAESNVGFAGTKQPSLTGKAD